MKIYISIDLYKYMTNRNPKPIKSTAINLDHALYVEFRALQPHANFSALVNTWLHSYVEELKKAE